MKTTLLSGLVLSSLFGVSPGHASPPAPAFGAQLEQTGSALPNSDNQQVYGRDSAALVAEDTARSLVSRFKEAYPRMGSPRIVLLVNRKASEPRQEQSLSDRQTTRDIERLFGRVLRAGGAMITDQESWERPEEGDAPKTDSLTELSKNAEVAIEILVSRKEQTLATPSGTVNVGVPDIQATAIRLSDSAILGQASATDVIGQGAEAAQLARTHEVTEITEATALALMEDILSALRPDPAPNAP